MKSYTYGDSEWKDLLTAYNGQSITYDGIGNPTRYYTGNGFTWTEGRRLTGISTLDLDYTYRYGENGERIWKDNGNGIIYYKWLDGRIYEEKAWTYTLTYFYDEAGKHIGFKYKSGTTEETYYYLYNLQGDVIGLLDSTGAQVVSYTYDPWGKPLTVTGTLATTIGSINPIRYRGYYYDAETGFYYCQSRYYDPEIGRWINADGYVSTGQGITGYNMFAYCGNCPVMYYDPSGTCYLATGCCIEWIPCSYAKIYDGDGHLALCIEHASVSDKLVEYLLSYEAFSSVPYDDGYGNDTIGYGHHIQPGETYSSLTKEQATVLFKKDLQKFVNMVATYRFEQCIEWEPHQFDSMVSVAFNSGDGFKKIASRIISGESIEQAFTYLYTRENAKKGKDLGLWRRRMDECDIYLYGTYERDYRLP